MAEAEDLLSDAARHATVFVQDLWRRRRSVQERVPCVQLQDLARRLDLFLGAAFGSSYRLRPAQLPAPPTLLGILMRNDRSPRLQLPVPATDGLSIWLPPDLDLEDHALGQQLYRAMAASQAQRARRGAAALAAGLEPLERDVFLLVEAKAAEADLLKSLPGMAPALKQLRHWALSQRPPLSAFSRARQPLERLLRQLLIGDGSDCGNTDAAKNSLTAARRLIVDRDLLPAGFKEKHLGPSPLLKDLWTGDLYPPSRGGIQLDEAPVEAQKADDAELRSSRLRRRPDLREPRPDDESDEENQSPWMVQLDEPHPHAEDPMGLQRPTDRDQDGSADELSDMVSDLPEARLVATPGRPKEVLLSDDPPDSSLRINVLAGEVAAEQLRYPEWDYRSQSYAKNATVLELPAPPGPQAWVEETLAAHAGKLALIRRQFQLLRAQPQWLKRRPDGEEIDLDAYIESYSDFRGGASLMPNIYQTRRRSRLNLAITLLIDISGSTDGWIGHSRRVIDVEREALLLVCIALDSLGEVYSVQGFSGEGQQAVTVRTIKGFDEAYSDSVARRISALEPERYTRAGAAIRHATCGLMRQSAAHRLLLLLSDGKPNDNDHYEGLYGLEDTRQAINEARLQGVHPFCLTIDQQGSSYLPRVFGSQQYALLTKPDDLPQVLLDWMKRLIATS